MGSETTTHPVTLHLRVGRTHLLTAHSFVNIFVCDRMPRQHSQLTQLNMAPFEAAQEKRVTEAIKYYHQHPDIPKKRIAEKFTVKYHALNNRLAGHLPGNTRQCQVTRLSPTKDAGLKKYLGFLTRIGMPPSKRDVTFAANHILEGQGKERVSKDWPRRWLHRNKSLYISLRSKTLANKRKKSHQIEDLQRHFADF